MVNQSTFTVDQGTFTLISKPELQYTGGIPAELTGLWHVTYFGLFTNIVYGFVQ